MRIGFSGADFDEADNSGPVNFEAKQFCQQCLYLPGTFAFVKLPCEDLFLIGNQTAPESARTVAFILSSRHIFLLAFCCVI